MVRFAVSDTGIGMTEEQLVHECVHGRRSVCAPRGRGNGDRVDHGRWFIVKRPARGAMIGPGTPAKAEAPAPETGDDV
jgi:hypothetical protein